MRRILVLVLALGLAAAACGGGDGAGELVTELDVSMTEFAFEPAEHVVPAGEQITLNLSNDGSVEHEWTLLKLDTKLEAEADFEESMVEFEAELDAGESGTFTFTSPGPGQYQVVCVIPGHFTAGMEGRLRVIDNG